MRVIGVILNLNWRMVVGGDDVVGWRSPVTTPANPLWPYQQMAAQIPTIAAAGFSVIGLPPSTQGAAGVFSGGYDKYDDYSLENTAFGTAEMLRQLVAVAHAYGLRVYGDLVLHQYDGGANGVYPTTRFPKTASCFSGIAGGVAADPVPDTTGNFAFGDLAAYAEGRLALTDQPGYMHDGAIAASQWLVLTTGLDGFRIDDAKGTNSPVVYDILHSEYLTESYAFYEYFDGNPGPVSNYVNGYQHRRGPVMDFATKFNVGNICNNNSRVWMGQLANIGYCNIDSAMSLTFVESADTDTSPGEQIIWNKPLGYGILLAWPGYQEVYYRDWSSDDNCYGLTNPINNMVWCANNLLQGDFVARLDTHPQVFAAERLGYGDAPGALFFCNNDQYNEYTVTVSTSFGAYQEVHEFTPNGPYNNTWTDGQGNLTVTVPKNNNGYSYLVYAKPFEAPPMVVAPITTTQTFFGAEDLPASPPLPAAGTITIGRVWAAVDTLLSATLTPDQTGWGNTPQILVEIFDPNDALVGDVNYDDQADSIAQGTTIKVSTAGWHTLAATTTGLPDGGSAVELQVIYTGASM